MREWPTWLEHTWFGWVTQLTATGMERSLVPDDCFPLPAQLSTRECTDRLAARWEAAGPGGKLWRILLAEHGCEVRWLCLWSVLNAVGELCRPCSVYALLRVLEKDDPDDLPVGLGLCGGLLLASVLGQVSIVNYYFIAKSQIGSKLLGSVHGLVLRKTIRMPVSGCDKSEVNLVAADAQMILEGCFWGVRLSGFMVMIGVSIGLLIWLLGWAAACAIVLLVSLVGLQSAVGRLQGRQQRHKQAHADSRIQQVLEAVSGIGVLKQQVWEASRMMEIDKDRAPELSRLKRIRLLFSTNEVLSGSIGALVVFMAFAIYSESHTLDSATVFTSLAIFNILRQPLTFIPIIADALVKGSVSCGRVQSYLRQRDLEPLYSERAVKIDVLSMDQQPLVLSKTDVAEMEYTKPEQPPAPLIKSDGHVINSVSSKSAIAMSGIFGYGSDSDFSLKAEMAVEQGQIIGVCGRVGAGKSSLLRALLRELDPLPGTVSRVELNGALALAPQVAWIQRGSVRDSILFGSAFDPAWYQEVVVACALDVDFQSMPNGDLTEIGERGISLSGGQQARLSIARCAYSRPDIVLLDDPLAALDQNVASAVFNNCLQKLMKGCTVVLVLNQLHLLERCHRVVFLSGAPSAVAHSGTLVELTAQQPEFAFMLKEYGAATEQANDAEGSLVVACKSEGDLIKTGDAASCKGPEESKEEGTIKLGTWAGLIKACGGWVFVANMVAALLTTGLALAALDFFLAWWVDDLEDNPDTSSTRHLIMLAGAVASIILATLWRTLTFAFGFLRAARIMHQDALSAVLYSPMRFFHTQSTGRIVNRFSGDLLVMEQQLTIFGEHCMLCLMMVILSLIIICVLIPEFLAVLAIMVVIFVLVVRRYQATFRDLKRIHAISKSPCLQLLTEVVDGRSAIRSFGMEEYTTSVFYQICDNHTRSWYTMTCCQWWQYIRISMIGASAVFVIAISCVLLRNSLSPGYVGLVLNFALLHTWYLTGLVILACEAEGSMAATERLYEFTQLPAEALDTATDSSVQPSADWPAAGRVEIRGLKARYAAHLPPALSIDEFVIPAGQSLGLVGRTGSGKTTMINCLFRMLPIDSGCPAGLGGYESGTGLQLLRSRLSVIPQHPMLFQGALRDNIDPFHQLSDEEVLEAVTQAGLHSLNEEFKLSEAPAASLLLQEVGAAGESLSVGTRQLVCIARALARKTRVVLCDEATASLDQETDSLVMHALQNHFGHATCIIVAHRLHTVITCDTVAVVDKGQIAESGEPDTLLTSNPTGMFAQLVDACGSQTAQALKSQASKASAAKKAR